MRLYMDGDWFDALPPGSTYENEFEGLILSHAQSLFPGFHCLRFDPLISTPLGDVKPDLALIDKSYRVWHIVEVELSTHSITRHVKPQMEKLDASRPGAEHADWLADRYSALDRSRVRRLVQDVPHGTVLLTNAATPNWDDALASLPAVRRAVVEVYRSRLNRTILRVNGSQPELPGDLVSPLTPGSGHLANSYRVDLVSALPDSLSAIEVSVGETLYRYRVRRLGDQKYLFPSASAPIKQKAVRLLVDSANQYRIED